MERTRMIEHTFTPGPTSNTVRTTDGRLLTVAEGWILLPPVTPP
jgi:hypothetical protein